MLILRAQVHLGRSGAFDISPLLDGPETEILTEEEEFPQERIKFAETALSQCPPEYIPVLKELLIRGTMEQGEIDAFCAYMVLEWVINFSLLWEGEPLSSKLAKDTKFGSTRSLFRS